MRRGLTKFSPSRSKGARQPSSAMKAETGNRGSTWTPVPTAGGKESGNTNLKSFNWRALQISRKSAFFPRMCSRSRSLTQLSFSADGNGRRASGQTSPWIKIPIGSAKMFHYISRFRISTPMFRCTLGTRSGTLAWSSESRFKTPQGTPYQ